MPWCWSIHGNRLQKSRFDILYYWLQSETVWHLTVFERKKAWPYARLQICTCQCGLPKRALKSCCEFPPQIFPPFFARFGLVSHVTWCPWPLSELTIDFYSWITWFLSTRSKSNWWQKKLDLRICRPPLFPLSRLCWWPLHLQMVVNMWCLSPSCSRCRVFRPTTPLSLTSPCTPAQHPAPSQVPTALPCTIFTKCTCNASPLCTVHFGITCSNVLCGSTV